jgi:predicted permease
VRFEVGLDPAAAAFALALSLGVTILFGLLPALRISGHAPAQALKEGSLRAGAGPGIRRAQSVLAAAQMAFAVALLTGAGLMVKSALEIRRDSPGFEPRNLLFADLGMDGAAYGVPGAASRLGRELLARVRAIPGVTDATFSEGLPLGLGGPKGVGGAFEGLDGPGSQSLAFSRNLVGPDFFRTFRIPVLSGREFASTDREGTLPVVMVNKSLADRFFGGADPVGRRLRINGEWRAIVGVCGDFKFQTWADRETPFVFMPLEQWGPARWNLAVRAAAPGVADAVRREVAALDPTLAVTLRPMEEVARNSAFLVRTSALAMGALGLTALFLAAVGIYGVVAHAVSQRTPEIGVRAALGAGPGAILSLVFRQGLAFSLAGTAAGMAGAFALGRGFADLLHRTSPAEPVVFLGVPAILLGVAALACLLPAFRALRIPPSAALRDE